MSMESPAIERKDQRSVAARTLRGKTCLVTGASRGIGRAIALELARLGADVAVNYHSAERAARTVAAAIEAEDVETMTVEADIGTLDDVLAMAGRVHDELGAIDVLVNNAGVTIDRRFDRMSPEEWHRVIAVNLGGAFYCTKAFYEDLKNAPHGRVINVSSVIGHRGNYGQSNYAAAKSGLFGFTRSLALELAPHGSTANCIAPGYTSTDMVAEVREDIKDQLRDEIPLGRFARAEEIACVAGFLASEDASYITGEVINVNGGMYS